MLLDPAQAERPDHGTEPEGREEQAVAGRVEAELPVGDQRQQRPHRAGGRDEAGQAEQDPSDHRLVPHVAPAGHQGGEEGLPLAVGDPRTAPGQQHHGQDGGADRGQREDRRHAPAGDHHSGDGRAGGPGHVDADHVEPGGRGQLVPGTSSVISDCQAGFSIAAPAPTAKVKREQQGGRHHAAAVSTASRTATTTK